MIQRIQTFYLALTAILSIIFLNGHILKFPGDPKNVLEISSRGIIITGNTGGPGITWTLTALVVSVLVIILMSVVAVFLFKKRRTQLRLTSICIIFSCLLIILSAVYFILVRFNYTGELHAGLNVFIMPFMLLFSILAYRGIKRDEELVRSYERIR